MILTVDVIKIRYLDIYIDYYSLHIFINVFNIIKSLLLVFFDNFSYHFVKCHELFFLYILQGHLETF